MNTSIPHRELGSSTAHRQGAVLRWALGGTVTLLASYLIGLELQRRGWATYQFPQTVLWCLIPYAVTAHWLYSGAYLPQFEGRSFLIVATAVPYLATPLGFALLQRPYSRGAVLLSYLLSAAWFLAGHWRQRRLHALRLACLDASVPSRLRELLGTPAGTGLRHIALRPWAEFTASSPSARPGDEAPWAGVVLDTRTPPDEARERQICALRLQHVRLYSVETVAELLSGRKMLPAASVHDLWALDGHPAYDSVKRLLDAALVIATLPLWLPLCLLVGLGVKLDSPGPMLFSQMRVGRNGRPFRLWKLRSMRTATPGTESARFASVDDERITRLGRFIRRMRLDELPQLWNVLRGDMSLIGPRPEQAQFVEAFAARIPAYPYRHLVRPGLTGWAQVQQGYAGSEEETSVKLSYDLYYLEHYSLSLDLLIAYKTVRIVLTGFGAR
jgi:lipopolysaccharide/colanic/teichoic acid biosynthesis glycosyltransferase